MSARGNGRDEADSASSPVSDTIRRIGAAWAVIDEIRVGYGPQSDAVDGLHLALQCALSKQPGVACGAVTLIAPRGTGKSATYEQFVNEVKSETTDGRMLVLNVSMDTTGTVESVPTAILAALKDPRPDLGSPRLRWLKAVSKLEDAGVRLLMLDEFSRAARRPTLSGPIGHAICEKIMDAGVAAVAFAGEEDASLVFRRAPLLLERVDEELDLSPLDWLRPGDEKIWTDFLRDFDDEMKRRDLVAAQTGFGDPEFARLLCEASGGIVRRFVKIVRLAISDAMMRGDDVISRQDVRTAAQSFSVGRGFIDANPFDRTKR